MRSSRGGRSLGLVAARVATGVTAALGRDLDRLLGARVVAVGVVVDLLGGGGETTSVVDDLDALVVGVEGGVAKVGRAARPLDGAGVVALGTGRPGTDADSHGSLGVAAGDGGSRQGADDVAVDDPLDGLGSPVDGVGVGASQGAGGIVGLAKVVLGEVALGEDVGLDLVGLGTEELPVDLVTVLGHEDDGADDAAAGGSLHLNIDAAEEQVLIGEDGGGLLGLVEAEESSLAGEVGNVSASGGGEAVAKLLGQVARVLLVTVGGVGRAGWNFMLVAV